MKTKSIILSGLLLIGLGAATTSCEDMFTPDNEHVTTDLAPQDTVYQVMGIVGKMQHIVDRTILLGEVRADLVEVPVTADKNLQDLANHVAGLDNAYNDPADYYAVINSCNIYLEYVNDTLKTYGEYKFKNEIIAVKAFRAWTYLELAKIYGEVPLILEPIISANAAEEAVNSTTNRADMVKICDTFIEDLAPYAYEDKNNALRPSYGATYGGKSVSDMFIPVRLMLGELYLWRGSFTGNKEDFRNAARYYHNFLTFPGEERRVSGDFDEWYNSDFSLYLSGSYAMNFSLALDVYGENNVMFVPMDTAQYFGTFSELKGLFNSLYENNYYPSIVPSTRLREISQGPTYCYARTNTSNVYVGSSYAPKDINDLSFNDPLMIGDLRLAGVYGAQSVNDKYNAALSTNRQAIAKHAKGTINPLNLTDIPNEYVVLYRASTIYLHMAEALNRAGFPETAFAVLKYGLAEDILSDRTVICQEEYDGLKQITSYGFAGDFTIWDENVFMSAREVMDRALLTAPSGYKVQRGIHDLGSGSSFVNDYYVIPTDSTKPTLNEDDAKRLWALLTVEEKDSLWNTYELDSVTFVGAVKAENEEWYAANQQRRIEEVDSLILEEMALENSFEGQRYYDLMRYSKYNEVGEYGDPSKARYLDKCVGMHKGKDNAEERLLDSWYLPLRQR